MLCLLLADAEQIGAKALGDEDGNEFTFAGLGVHRVEVNVAVYLDRVRIGAAVPQLLLIVEALDEHLHDLAVT